jgi:hypothetical protein
MVSRRRIASAPWGRCSAVVERDILRKVDYGSRASRSKSWQQVTVHVYAVAPRAIGQDLITVEVNMLRHVRENAMWRPAGCTDMHGGRFV